VRLIWRDDPATSAVLAWVQATDSTSGVVHYGPEDHGDDVAAYPLRHEPDRAGMVRGLQQQFARLSGLRPDSEYFAVIVTAEGRSRRYRFRTAPDTPQAFTFVAGGDSRNHRTARRNANLMVRKLRPLFVAFAGDMTDRDTDQQWHEWLEDWTLTTSEDGHLIPIVAARGNHEDRNQTVSEIFDSPHPEITFALDVGGSLFRLYTLNSMIPAGGDQAAWLAEDLAAHEDVRWLVAQYHKPMRPHVERKSEQIRQYRAWAPLFYQHGLALAIECDSHCVKRTWPLRPSTAVGSHEGFIRDDARGTVFIGEGCWGAPLRPANDAKPWTRASGSFNQVHWIQVRPEHIEVRTVRIDNAEEVGSVDPADPYAAPSGIEIWEPASGATVRIDPIDPEPLPGAATRELALVAIAPEIQASQRVFRDRTQITIEAASDLPGALRYTLDGSAPDLDSTLYQGPFELETSAQVATAWVTPEGERSTVSRLRVEKLPAPVGTRGPQPTLRLDDLDWESQSAGWGETRVDRSVGGRPLEIGMQTYEHGLGMHAVGHVTYALEQDWSRFVATVGLHSRARPVASATAQVLADGEVIWESPQVMRVLETFHVDVAIPTGTQRLTLRVGDGGDGPSWDNVDWADAGLLNQ